MARVKILQGDGDPAYGDQNTDGSTSVRRIYEAMRRVGATARVMLVAAAAKSWRVATATCEARDHAVFRAASRRALGFGELATDAARLPVPAPEQVALRPRAELRHVETALPLLDAPDMVTGRAVYGADVRLPGMLIALIARPPVVGGKAAHHDATRALATPGVKRVVELPAPTRPYGFQPLGGVAVLAETTWAAMRGRAALDVTWTPGDNVSYESTKYREVLTAAVRMPGQVVRKVGDADAALANAARRVEAEYHVPHLAHAAMEPPAAVARAEVARALGIEPSRVTVHVTLLGGGFGRKSKPDYVVEAALLSRAAGVPVRVQWTREDDIRHGYFHSTSAQRLVAGLGADGKVTAWLHRAAFPPISSTFKPGVTHADVGELQQGMLDFPLAISERWQTMVTRPSGATWMKTLGVRPPCGSGVSDASARRGGSPTARVVNVRPRPARNERRGRVVELLIASSSLARTPGRLAHGRADPGVGAAATEVAGERLIDLRVGRPGPLPQQRRGRHDLPGLAEAALRDAELHPRALQRVLTVGREALDGGHGPPLGAPQRRHAGPHRLAVEVHGARAAERLAAPVLGPGEAEHVAQRPGERHRGSRKSVCLLKAPPRRRR